MCCGLTNQHFQSYLMTRQIVQCSGSMHILLLYGVSEQTISSRFSASRACSQQLPNQQTFSDKQNVCPGSRHVACEGCTSPYSTTVYLKDMQQNRTWIFHSSCKSDGTQFLLILRGLIWTAQSFTLPILNWSRDEMF